MTYPEALRYLGSFINYERMPRWPYKESFKLDRFRYFLSSIGNPEKALRCIHVAGSKGKGSTCAFITYILREAGFKVGLYTSPHLSDFRERIRILETHPRPLKHARGDFEGMISRRALCILVEKLKPEIKAYARRCPQGSQLSFFEVYTGLAFVYFKEQGVDFAVLETGLGGRLDATNTVSALVSVLTPISYEHMQKLGSTLTEIAREKAGIIKTHGALVVTAPQEQEAAAVIRARCARFKGVRLFEVGKDIILEKAGDRGMNVKGMFAEYKNLKVRLMGAHQQTNACVAVGAVEALRYRGIRVGVEPVRLGLYNVLWPGRCEIVSRRPMVVLDGAQNAASARALREALIRDYRYQRLILVMGISDDKDIMGICQQLSVTADSIVLTQARNPRAADVDDIERIINFGFVRPGARIIKTRNVRHAIRQALAQARERDLIIVTGSLFVVGQAREILLKRRHYGTKKIL